MRGQARGARAFPAFVLLAALVVLPAVGSPCCPIVGSNLVAGAEEPIQPCRSTAYDSGVRPLAEPAQKAASTLGPDAAVASGLEPTTSPSADHARGLAPKRGVPEAFGTPYRQLSPSAYARLRARVADRTITREQWSRLRWHERLSARREQGIADFWAAERRNLQAGLPGTRNWSIEARNAILAGERPAGIFSHHRFSVSQYPQLASDPANVYPVTFYEHFFRWHGGSWANPSHGVPVNPGFPEWF